MCFLVVYRPKVEVIIEKHNRICLLYTSDAADEL